MSVIYSTGAVLPARRFRSGVARKSSLPSPTYDITRRDALFQELQNKREELRGLASKLTKPQRSVSFTASKGRRKFGVAARETATQIRHKMNVVEQRIAWLETTLNNLLLENVR